MDNEINADARAWPGATVMLQALDGRAPAGLLSPLRLGSLCDTTQASFQVRIEYLENAVEEETIKGIVDKGVISDASGPERYTLSIPYFVLSESLSFDTELLTKPLTTRLGVPVRHEARNGYQRLVVGPFASNARAVSAFDVVWAFLARLAVVHRFPMMFDHALHALRETPKLVTWDNRPIHAIACLAFPQVIPEHMYVLEDDVIVATRQAQLIPLRLAETFIRPVASKPIGWRLELAFNAYVAAFATRTNSLRFLGLTSMLEVLMEDEARTPEEQAVLDRIAASIKGDRSLRESEVSRRMMDNAVQAISSRKNLSKSASLGQLIARHLKSINRSLGRNQEVADPAKLARNIYDLRSSVTHAGRMAEGDSARSTEQALLAVSEGVLLDWLDGMGSEERT